MHVSRNSKNIRYMYGEQLMHSIYVLKQTLNANLLYVKRTFQFLLWIPYLYMVEGKISTAQHPCQLRYSFAILSLICQFTYITINIPTNPSMKQLWIMHYHYTISYHLLCIADRPRIPGKIIHCAHKDSGQKLTILKPQERFLQCKQFHSNLDYRLDSGDK